MTSEVNVERLEGQHIAGSGRLVDYSNLVKLPHTVFAAQDTQARRREIRRAPRGSG